jgi:hypothetical protein
MSFSSIFAFALLLSSSQFESEVLSKVPASLGTNHLGENVSSLLIGAEILAIN